MSFGAFGRSRSTHPLRGGRGQVVVELEGITLEARGRSHRLAWGEVEAVVRRRAGLWLITRTGDVALPRSALDDDQLAAIEAEARAMLAATQPPERLAQIAEHERREREQAHTPPVASMIVLVIGVVVFAALWSITHGAIDENVERVVGMGALSRALVDSGQYYRLFSAAFVHLSWLHALLDLGAVYSLRAVERWMGTARYVVVFAAGTLAGNVALVVWTPDAVGAGSSTGLFGVLAALVVVHLAWRSEPSGGLRTSGVALALMVAVNAAISFVPQVSGAGHAGGFVGGLVAALLVVPTPRRAGLLPLPLVRALAAGMGALALASAGYGVVYKPLAHPDAARADAMIAATSPMAANAVAWGIAIDARATDEDLARAEAISRRALEQQAEPFIEDTLAVVLERRGQLDEAITRERRVLARAPEAMFARALLRMIEAKGAPLGDPERQWRVRAVDDGLLVAGPAAPEGAVLFVRSRSDLHRVLVPARPSAFEAHAEALGVAASSTVTLMWVAPGPPLEGETDMAIALRER